MAPAPGAASASATSGGRGAAVEQAEDENAAEASGANPVDSAAVERQLRAAKALLYPPRLAHPVGFHGFRAPAEGGPTRPAAATDSGGAGGGEAREARAVTFPEWDAVVMPYVRRAYADENMLLAQERPDGGAAVAAAREARARMHLALASLLHLRSHVKVAVVSVVGFAVGGVKPTQAGDWVLLVRATERGLKQMAVECGYPLQLLNVPGEDDADRMALATRKSHVRMGIARCVAALGRETVTAPAFAAAQQREVAEALSGAAEGLAAVRHRWDEHYLGPTAQFTNVHDSRALWLRFRDADAVLGGRGYGRGEAGTSAVGGAVLDAERDIAERVGVSYFFPADRLRLLHRMLLTVPWLDGIAPSMHYRSVMGRRLATTLGHRVCGRRCAVPDDLLPPSTGAGAAAPLASVGGGGSAASGGGAAGVAGAGERRSRGGACARRLPALALRCCCGCRPCMAAYGDPYARVLTEGSLADVGKWDAGPELRWLHAPEQLWTLQLRYREEVLAGMFAATSPQLLHGIRRYFGEGIATVVLLLRVWRRHILRLALLLVAARVLFAEALNRLAFGDATGDASKVAQYGWSGIVLLVWAAFFREVLMRHVALTFLLWGMPMKLSASAQCAPEEEDILRNQTAGIDLQASVASGVVDLAGGSRAAGSDPAHGDAAGGGAPIVARSGSDGSGGRGGPRGPTAAALRSGSHALAPPFLGAGRGAEEDGPSFRAVHGRWYSVPWLGHGVTQARKLLFVALLLLFLGLQDGAFFGFALVACAVDNGCDLFRSCDALDADSSGRRHPGPRFVVTLGVLMGLLVFGVKLGATAWRRRRAYPQTTPATAGLSAADERYLAMRRLRASAKRAAGLLQPADPLAGPDALRRVRLPGAPGLPRGQAAPQDALDAVQQALAELPRHHDVAHRHYGAADMEEDVALWLVVVLASHFWSVFYLAIADQYHEINCGRMCVDGNCFEAAGWHLFALNVVNLLGDVLLAQLANGRRTGNAAGMCFPCCVICGTRMAGARGDVFAATAAGTATAGGGGAPPNDEEGVRRFGLLPAWTPYYLRHSPGAPAALGPDVVLHGRRLSNATLRADVARPTRYRNLLWRGWERDWFLARRRQDRAGPAAGLVPCCLRVLRSQPNRHARLLRHDARHAEALLSPAYPRGRAALAVLTSPRTSADGTPSPGVTSRSSAASGRPDTNFRIPMTSVGSGDGGAPGAAGRGASAAAAGSAARAVGLVRCALGRAQRPWPG